VRARRRSPKLVCPNTRRLGMRRASQLQLRDTI
jgi:hypothetical protein